MSKSIAKFGFILMDYLTGGIAWSLFYVFRKTKIEQQAFDVDIKFWLGILLIPFFWILLYGVLGTYKDVFRLHRLKIISHTLAASFIGVIVLFFAFLLDDQVQTYQTYYKSIASLFFYHSFVTLIPRFILISFFVKAVQNGKIGFKTLLVGGSEKAIAIYEEIKSLPKSMGHQFIGFVNLNGIDTQLKDKLNYLGHADGIEKLLEKEQIEEVIIALDTSEHEKLRHIVSVISPHDVSIKLIPDMYDILSGSVKMSNIFGTMLIEINRDPMPVWQRHTKRIMDIVISTVAMIILIPLYLFLAIWVKISSKGPVFFRQERIGLNGKPFQILKFRTMYTDAEKNGPQLSSEHDPRITPAGRVMRKYRLDEFPQFFNVILGDMSLVGPRPERQFYIDQISLREPQYLELTRIRPGITSWGQVKYGYAENVDQMIQRMKYDLLYMRNMSLALDIKIMFYTVLIVFMAKGK